MYACYINHIYTQRFIVIDPYTTKYPSKGKPKSLGNYM